MNRKITIKIVGIFFLLLSPVAIAQEVIKGSVTNMLSNSAMSATVVSEKGTHTAVVSSLDGKFSISVPKLPTTLVFSHKGFKNKEILVTSTDELSVGMDPIAKGVVLDAFVLVGNRAKPRTMIESPVAVDNITAEELAASGQLELDKMLAYRVPSYNSTNQTVSDGTAHFDPSELRNLGPSRTLVLINGKRKNQSGLVYVNKTIGRGEVGVDMKSIPVEAIERVEVLRDGASAQYGSDAIAGVINIVLKEDVDATHVKLNTGVSTEGDGLTYSGSVNTSLNAQNGAYANFTGEFYHQDDTDRAGTPGSDTFVSNVLEGTLPANDPLFTQLENGTHPWIQQNPDLGMTIGEPSYDRVGFSYNAELPYAEGHAALYSFGTLERREGSSYAFYRAPYWIPDPNNLLHEAGTTYQGFQPTFESSITDYTAVIGNRWDMFGGWNVDLSYTYGSNTIAHEVGNSLNQGLAAQSPTRFDAGGYSFSHHVGNLDVSKSFGAVGLTLGSELRQEHFVSKAGEEASYVSTGAVSFPGINVEDALKENRSNIGVYGGVDWDITEALLVSGAGRFENYSDFGDNISWKVAARYLLPNSRGVIRTSVNTGFRAPSLHQIYLKSSQTLVLTGGGIGRQGTFNNADPIIIDPTLGLGVPELKAEESFNITAGTTYRFSPKFSAALDYYNIKVDDRILLTTPLGDDGVAGVNAVEQVLNDNNIDEITFFVNALDTKTQGVDVVVNYSDISVGPGTLGVNAAVNWNETKINGTINVPEKIANAGYTDIFNRTEQSRVTTSRPDIKGVLGVNYAFSNWDFVLNNTYFGEVTLQHPTVPAFDQTFRGKVLTDISIAYQFTNWITAKAVANNIFDIYPDEVEAFGDPNTNLGGRFRYSREASQFGFKGTFLQLGVDITF